MSNVLFKALPAGLTDFFIVSALIMFSFEFGVDQDDVSTASVMLMGIVGFMILYRVSVPMNRWRLSIFLTMLAGFLFCLIFMKGLFAISYISVRCGMLLTIFAIASEPIFRYLTRGIYWIEETWKLVKHKRKQFTRRLDIDRDDD